MQLLDDNANKSEAATVLSRQCNRVNEMNGMNVVFKQTAFMILTQTVSSKFVTGERNLIVWIGRKIESYH